MLQDICLPQSFAQLTPSQAHFCLKLANFIENTLELSWQSKKILLTFSGGTDSLALLLSLFFLAEKKRLQLHVVHINHQIREESKQEAEWCRSLCVHLGLSFVEHKISVYQIMKDKKMGLEEAARFGRYQVFEQERAENNCDYIMTGHHLNDLAEDSLMRLLRGSGWPALAGMSAHCATKHILRPLLSFSRQELWDFVESFALKGLVDASNFDLQFLRNRVRHTILPLFIQENPNFLEHTYQLWLMGQEDKKKYTREYNALLEKSQVDHKTIDKKSMLEHRGKVYEFDFALSTDAIKQVDKSFRLRFLKEYLQSFEAFFSYKELVSIEKALMGKQFPKKLFFSSTVALLITNKYFLIYHSFNERH